MNVTGVGALCKPVLCARSDVAGSRLATWPVWFLFIVYLYIGGSEYVNRKGSGAL